jgi:hypothetical protein
VSAQIDFDQRCEPAQPESILTRGDVEGGLGEIILRRDGLHGGVVQPAIERTHAAGFPVNNRLAKAST